jgi:hypothetical protein
MHTAKSKSKENHTFRRGQIRCLLLLPFHFALDQSISFDACARIGFGVGYGYASKPQSPEPQSKSRPPPQRPNPSPLDAPF